MQIFAQGLFFYLAETKVAELVAKLSRRAQTSLVFDVVPPWTVLMSKLRPPVGRSLNMPRMQWGLRKSDASARVQRWSERPPQVEAETIPMGMGPLRFELPPALVVAHWD